MAALWMHDASLYTNVRSLIYPNKIVFQLKKKKNKILYFTETAEDVCDI